MSFNASQLPRLRPNSGQRLPTSTIYGLSTNSGGQTRLISPKFRGGSIIHVPRNKISDALRGLRSVRKVMTFTASNRDFMNSLNKDLQGGDSQPWLLLGLSLVFVPFGMVSGAVGIIATVGGVVFGVTTNSIESSRRSTNVMARLGDQIWHVEEIGRTLEDNVISADRWVATHISSYFLVDPFRRNQRVKGWLLHEDRTTIEVS